MQCVQSRGCNPTIIAISGRKGSGKNTLATFIRRWYIDNISEESTFMECSFADEVKKFCINVLGLQNKQCYGSDDDKNSETPYKWENVPKHIRWKFGGDSIVNRMILSGKTTDEILNVFYTIEYNKKLKSGFMSGRDIMQVLGTDLIRETFGNVWSGATIRNIYASGKSCAVITDNRFPNEAKDVLNEKNGFIIRLTRTPYGKRDVHPSESALDEFDWNDPKCFLLDNTQLSIEEQNNQTIPILQKIFTERKND